MQVETKKTYTITKELIIALVCEKFNLDPKKATTTIKYKPADDRFPNDEPTFESIQVTATEIHDI